VVGLIAIGYTATDDGTTTWCSYPRARRHLQMMRGRDHRCDDRSTPSSATGRHRRHETIGASSRALQPDLGYLMSERSWLETLRLAASSGSAPVAGCLAAGRSMTQPLTSDPRRQRPRRSAWSEPPLVDIDAMTAWLEWPTSPTRGHAHMD